MVDDHQFNVDQLEMLLQRGGYLNLRTITDSRQTLDVYKSFGPDLILLDLHMPHRNGFEIMDDLREIVPEYDYLPILVLTADINTETKRKALHSGAKDFLTKPFDQIEVLLRINNLLETRRLHLQLQEQNQALEVKVSERTRALETALQDFMNAQQKMIEQERMRALGRMASGIAHDFNNALFPILGYSDLLISHPDILEDTEKAIGWLKTINTSALDAGSVVKRLSEFYRPREETEVFGAVELNAIIEQSAELTRPKWRDQALAQDRNIEMKLELGDLPIVYGNKSEIRGMLTNLIFNAVDAMPKGGSIFIRTRPDEKFAVIEVEDSGTGMTGEVKRLCLEPFFTTKGPGGTGLGLAAVFGIIRRYEGQIKIDSELGKGTKFTIRLPFNSDGEKLKDETSPGTTVLPALNILVVEDEPFISDFISHYLSIDGHSCEVASNGKEGLDKFRAGQFDIVLTDRCMPVMNGDALAAAIKKQVPDQPIIMLTGLGDSMEATEEKPPGIDLILSKPVGQAELREALAALFFGGLPVASPPPSLKPTTPGP
ncbi:MAG: response regulator [Planctomycetota bacterium]|nr:response regulator [Planctomycetota bacterium]